MRNITVLMASTLQPSVNTSTVQSYWPTIQVNFCQEIMMIVSHIRIWSSYNLFDFLDISRSGNKSSLVQLIQSYKLNVKVAFLGPNLEYAVAYFER